MSKNLVIVESPAKAKTIEKYLGTDYHVVASFGHVRDLPKTELGVDIEHQFEPKYIIPTKAKKVVSALKSNVTGSDNIYLATDYDREGEAIAWHIIQACNLQDKKINIKDKKNIHRITFHEITKQAILDAVANPRQLDINLIDAQQARRVLDRLVGYKLSPFLWKKVAKGLSAGRVQSVAVRLIVDREREIEKFVPIEYWQLDGEFETQGKEKFTAELKQIDGKKILENSLTGLQAKKIEAELNSKPSAKISKVEDRVTNRYPSPPFQTSTLQQTASSRLGFGAKQTMKLAQDLYEDGLITYMRTDSTNLANQSIEAARKYIETNFGSKYLPEKPIVYKTKSKSAQEAHEAIRPTDPGKNPDSVEVPTPKHLKLYQLIWQRMIACQISPAKIDAIDVDVTVSAKSKYIFSTSGQRVAFDGFLKVYRSNIEEKTLPKLKVDETVNISKLQNVQKFTSPPARYNEASLVRALEKHGIGRPSTYAPTISTIQDRNYVRTENRVFFPEEIGKVVVDLLVEHFPEVVDIDFTAKLEDDLDSIAEGKLVWTKLIDNFYEPFAKHLVEKMDTVAKSDVAAQPTGEKCPECQKELLLRLGRFGKFYACSGFPDCKFTKRYVDSTGFKCPDCGDGDVVALRTKRKRPFFGCSNYPKCKYMTWDDPRRKSVKSSTSENK